MGWRRARGNPGEERAVLLRIVALLGALAGIAEYAAGSSPAMRAFLHFLLRHAETVALNSLGCGPWGQAGVCEKPGETGAREGASDCPTGGPEEAMRLAASLWALAWLVERQAMAMLLAMRGEAAARSPFSSCEKPALRGLLATSSTPA